MGRQTQTDDATDAPIHGSIISDLADEYGVDRGELAEYLSVANEMWQEWVDELRETHEVVADDDGKLIVLAAHSTETREMDKYALGEVDLDIPDVHGSRANLLQIAHDRQAKQYEYSVFGARQDAVDATGSADAVVVDLEGPTDE
jgi:hypothetical protein